MPCGSAAIEGLDRARFMPPAPFHPAAQQQGRVVDAAPLQRREQRDADVGFFGAARGERVLAGGERLVGLAAVELVGLGQQHQQLHRAVGQARATKSSSCRSRSVNPRRGVDHQHHAGPGCAAARDSRPSPAASALGIARHGGVAVARQVGEERVGRVFRPSANRLMCWCGPASSTRRPGASAASAC